MRFRLKKCKLESLPLLDYTKINREISCLEEIEEKEEAKL